MSSKVVSLVHSIDLYKVFNGSSDRLVVTKGGFNIGQICCAAPTCADDTSPMSDELSPLHSLVSEAEDFSVMELFVIQPSRVWSYLFRTICGNSRIVIYR